MDGGRNISHVIWECFSWVSSFPPKKFALSVAVKLVPRYYLVSYCNFFWKGGGSVVGIATGYGLDGPGIESL